MLRRNGFWPSIIVPISIFIWVLEEPANGNNSDNSLTACDVPGYMLIMGGIEDRTKIPAPVRSAKYGPAVASLVNSHGAYYVVQGRPKTVYEGNWPDWRVVIISHWPCQRAAHNFWYSDAYQKDTKPLRKDSGSYTVALFEATSPASKPARAIIPNACTDPIIILIMSKVTDTEKYNSYSRAIVDSNLPRRFGYKPLFMGQPREMLEGTWPEGYSVMISVWPCKDAWQRFYAGEPYVSDIKPLRKNAGEFLIMELEPRQFD